MSPQKLQKRKEIANFFQQTALTEQQKAQKIEFGDLLDKNDKKRVLVILPESLGDLFLSTSLFKSIRERYPRPEWAFYIATKPECKEILEGNPHIDRWIQYQPIMDNLGFLEGTAQNDGYFDVVYPLHFPTQRTISYWHNSCDVHGIELKENMEDNRASR